MAIVFKANRQQLTQLITNAVNASMCLGHNMVEYEAINYEPELFERFIIRDIAQSGNEYVSINLYKGRTVGLEIFEEKSFDNYKLWRIDQNDFSFDKQTFYSTYNTSISLIESCGLKLFNAFMPTELPDNAKALPYVVIKDTLYSVENLTEGQRLIDSVGASIILGIDALYVGFTVDEILSAKGYTNGT